MFDLHSGSSRALKFARSSSFDCTRGRCLPWGRCVVVWVRVTVWQCDGMFNEMQNFRGRGGVMGLMCDRGYEAFRVYFFDEVPVYKVVVRDRLFAVRTVVCCVFGYVLCIYSREVSVLFGGL